MAGTSQVHRSGLEAGYTLCNGKYRISGGPQDSSGWCVCAVQATQAKAYLTLQHWNALRSRQTWGADWRSAMQEGGLTEEDLLGEAQAVLKVR